MDNTKENIHKGHRQKVKERYLEVGLDSMPDHNVLEMLLFFAIPFKDTNETAHLLMEKFGSFSGVLKASVADLKNVKGMTENAACLISMLLPIYKRYTDDLVLKKPQLITTQDIVDFIKPKFIDCSNERAYVLCFDNKHSLICARLLDEGDIASATLNMRSLAATVLETKAKSCVLVHNHPNAIALPSAEDIDATKTASDLLQKLKVRLEDHLIIAENQYCSMINMPKCSHIFY